MIFENVTFLITTTTTTTITKRIMNKYVKSQPFDSWYIGGLLFMLMVIMVLLYANYYRENAFQILWNRLLTKLRIIRPSLQTTLSSSNPPMNTILI